MAQPTMLKYLGILRKRELKKVSGCLEQIRDILKSIYFPPTLINVFI